MTRHGTNLDDVLREVRQLRNVDSKTLITHTRLNLIQERDVPFALERVRSGDMRDDVQVLHVRNLLVERRQLVEVRREEAERVKLGCDFPARRRQSSFNDGYGAWECARTRIWPMRDRNRRTSTSLARARR